MKLSILIFTISILTSCTFHKHSVKQETETHIKDQMNFRINSETDLEKVIELAQRENKLIFIDIYAEWCGPCKDMDAKVYNDMELGAFMQENFINYKVDGEKHNGEEMCNKFAVIGYPTLLILDRSGNIVLRNDGLLNRISFMKMARQGIKDSQY